MKLSERFNSTPGSVACVVSLRDLVEFEDIYIPDVQRGLVWNPTQIAHLWESIFSGYPIGALTLYEQEGKWQLIDGQQRRHAIKLGLLPPYEEDEMTSLWSIWKRNDANSWAFDCLMVYTRRHPWGFCWVGGKLERISHEDMVTMWNEILKDKDIVNPFQIPTLKQAAAYMMDKEKSRKMIPLYQLLMTEADFDVKDEGDAAIWKQTEKWRRLVEAPTLPLIRFDLKCDDDFEKNRIQELVKKQPSSGGSDDGLEKNRIQELFTRINKGGTPISNVDLAFSSLCSYMGSKFKGEINETAKGFLPPSRVARLYARLAHAIQRGTLKEPDSAAYWRDHQYNENVTKAVRDARDLLKEAEIPASIYLSATGDEWLSVMCWCMWRFAGLPGAFSDKKLLCMLPYVVCRDSGYHTHFCERFYEALNDANLKVTNLLELMAIGVAYAACYSTKTGMYPLMMPQKAELKSEYDAYDEEWLHIFVNPGNTALLHFLQAPYMNRLLRKECGFYPHEPATWGEAMNRPWDVDHIVPQSRWWRLEQDELLYQESLANKQMLYYRRNREKQDSYIGVPADDDIHPARDFCYPHAVLLNHPVLLNHQYYGWEGRRVYNKRPAKLHFGLREKSKNDYTNALAGYKEVINRRLAEMVNRLWRELGIAKLVDTINAIPDMEEIPACMELPVACWRYLKDMPDAENLEWCAIRHDESRQQEIAVKDFYHSLCSWLAVGVEENDAFLCFCWQQVNVRTLKIKGGKRRLPGLTQTEWMERAGEASRSAWWVEDGSFKDGIYVHEPGSGLKAVVDGLKTVVDSVKPHSGE